MMFQQQHHHQQRNDDDDDDVLLLFLYFPLETEKCYDIVLNICFPFFVLYFSEQKPETQEKNRWYLPEKRRNP